MTPEYLARLAAGDTSLLPPAKCSACAGAGGRYVGGSVMGNWVDIGVWQECGCIEQQARREKRGRE